MDLCRPRSSLTLIALVLTTACLLESDPWLEVVVTDRGRPVSGAQVSVQTQQPEAQTRTAETDATGSARLEPGTSGRVHVEVLLITDDRAFFTNRELTVGLGRTLRLRLEDDFEQGPALRAFEPAAGDEPHREDVRFRHGQPELDHDRRVSAVVEIDRVHGVPELPLVALTSDGPIRLEDIFDGVGITLRVVWSDVVPAAVLGAEPWPGEDRLTRIMGRFRNLDARHEEWAFYLLLIPRPRPGVELSLLIDQATRTGAVVCIDPQVRNPAESLHAVAHELGHLLNLPHPWESYGDTRSIMTYPWRWSDWDWSDPRGFRFDAPGRRHILRGPEVAVRPGAGPFSPPPVAEAQNRGPSGPAVR